MLVVYFLYFTIYKPKTPASLLQSLKFGKPKKKIQKFSLIDSLAPSHFQNTKTSLFCFSSNLNLLFFYLIFAPTVSNTLC